MTKLDPQTIHDAAFDDQLFAALPGMLAKLVGARSAVMHWSDADSGTIIAAHNGYYQDAHLQMFADHFVPDDKWTHAAMRFSTVNRAWAASVLVDPAEYRRGRFFNEWIRAIGDDTFHCCGAMLATPFGFGGLGLHRGETQADFDPLDAARLGRLVEPLRHLFSLRARIQQLTDRTRLLEAALADDSQPTMLIGPGGRLALANAGGEALLVDGGLLQLAGGTVAAAPGADAGHAFATALAAALSPASAQAQTLCIGRAGAQRLLSLMPVVLPGRGGFVLVTLAPLPSPATA
jgi:hypothetical protein